MGPLRPSLPPMLLAAWPVPSRPVLPCLGPPGLAVLTAPPGSLCPSHGGASPDPTIGSYGCPYRSRPPPREAAEAHTRMWCPEERALRPQPAFCWSRAALLRRLVPVFPALPQPVPAAWVASHGPQCSAPARDTPVWESPAQGSSCCREAALCLRSYGSVIAEVFPLGLCLPRFRAWGTPVTGTVG